MKNIKRFLIFSLGILYACNTPDKNSGQQTPVEKDSVKQTQPAGDNFVKSEAPDAETKEDQGYAMPTRKGGSSQSPIDILSSNAEKDQNPAISMKFSGIIEAAENLGHTVQVDFRSGSTCILRGKKYTPKQFHFHTPSEHLVDGMTFPMEMHIVNLQNDSAQNSAPHFMVIGVLFKMGHENKFIQEFLKEVPEEEGQKHAIAPGSVRFEDFLSQIPVKEENAYFTYKGSLTTPPFSETVEWVVLQHILEASPDQIIAIEKLEGNNARHVHDLLDRKLYVH